jgi:serine/threonine-protein kinase RsbW
VIGGACVTVAAGGATGREGQTSMGAKGLSATGPLRFTISSDLSETRHVQDAIMAAVAAAQWGEDDTFAIKLSLEEAIINAIKHGNRFDKAKTVQVEARVSPEQIEIEIEDEGPGFNPDAVPDPTLDENLEKCSGRGILLIHAYMTSVTWSKEGRRVHLVKRRSA